MKTLQEKIKKSQKAIKKAYQQFPREKIVIAWTGGKDSTVLLHLVRSIFNSVVPFPVMFNDSTMEFEEIYEFIKELTKKWGLNLIVVPHSKGELEKFNKTKNVERKKELSRLMKINAINAFLKKNHIDAFMAGIRWDEHPARSKETYLSKRKDHMRIHPILHFTEADIWTYIKTYKVPYVKLYDKGYRSLGEKPFTKKAKKGEGERSGREYDKEHMMQKLRSLGYW
jgi:phosphoadenosine phosphosulfate reductase